MGQPKGWTIKRHYPFPKSSDTQMQIGLYCFTYFYYFTVNLKTYTMEDGVQAKNVVKWLLSIAWYQ